MTVNAKAVRNNVQTDDPHVSAVPHDLSPVELERHITSCGELMLEAYGRYEVSSDLQDRAEADRWRLMQAEAIKARKTGWIVAMEKARGLA